MILTIRDWRRRLAKLLAALLLLGMPGMDALTVLPAYAINYDREIISDADALQAGDRLFPGSGIARDGQSWDTVDPGTNRFWASSTHCIEYRFVGGTALPGTLRRRMTCI